MLDKTYRPEEVEAKQYAAWVRSGAFHSGRRPEARPFTMMIPPPNVTGVLHMGHAFNNTLQDILARFERMRGRDVLWQPGSDHAGIATQMVVERELELEQSSRRKIGREAFVARVWQWKERSGNAITNQLRRLGASCDWGRERFTMDEGLSRAVTKVFVELYRQGLLYKDKRLVNWDPKLLTAISDLEVESREVEGQLWYFRYPIEGDQERFITIATTRPETMLGDTGVAVHPDDPRYRDLVGRHVILPLVGRRIPIVADEHADPEQGSGAVKITPAHDFNDFEVGRRHGLEMIPVMDEHAQINEHAPETYRGLDRFAAREKVVEDLRALGLVERIEDHVLSVPYGDRSGEVLEPFLTDQWYVDAATLARPAIEAVEKGEMRFVPRHWEKTYFEWMRNIQPWCVSRQLWWGHQIPAWYGPDGEIFVAYDEAEAAKLAGSHYGEEVALVRDEDVLDTWFSSALWPFSTLGWPDETPELARYYPTNALVTAFDIIFFWVARMMMMGLHFMRDVPFHTVYIHALVRDEKGQKMSKSKGNAIDPLELMDKYGADSLRFTLTALAAQGREIKLAESRVEGYRNFVTKLWNAARFCEMNGAHPAPDFDPSSARECVNRWIIGEARKTTQIVTEAIEGYRFNDAATALYQFIWGTFCDWYLEFAKPLFGGADEGAAEETRLTAGWVLDRILVLAHPFMPFVTEELWERLAEAAGVTRETPLVLAAWPASDVPLRDSADAAEEMDWVIRLVSEVRALRAGTSVPAGARIPLLLRGASKASAARLDRHRDLILRLARLGRAGTTSGAVPEGAIQSVFDEATIVLPLAEVMDIAKERERLAREIDKITADIARIDRKLGNENFVTKAPEEIVEEQRERRADADRARTKLIEAMARLERAS